MGSRDVWWFVVHGSETDLTLLEKEWEKDNIQTSWLLEPCFMPEHNLPYHLMWHHLRKLAPNLCKAASITQPLLPQLSVAQTKSKKHNSGNCQTQDIQTTESPLQSPESSEHNTTTLLELNSSVVYNSLQKNYFILMYVVLYLN